MNAHSQTISVTVPVTEAIERVKGMLFRPFDASKWFTIGFCAWLATLGNRGISFNYRSGGSQYKGNGREFFEQAQRFVMNNLYWILPVFLMLMLLGLAVGVVLLWLRSQGQFMFLHCVALDKAEIDVPWRQFSAEGNSLFQFRLVFGFGGMALLIPFIIAMVLLVIATVHQGTPDLYLLLPLIGMGFTIVAMATVLAIISKLTTDFVVPIMFLHRCKCLDGWRELGLLVSAHLGQFVVYLLFQIVLAMAIGVIVVIGVIATCCIAGCLMLLPYLGAVLLLPVSVFKRSYSLYYLAQYGREYDVFPPPLLTMVPPSAST